MWSKVKQVVRRLIVENSGPEEIALGVSIGVFICMLPLYGFHTLLVIAFCFLIPKANKIAMLLGTNVSLPPTVPFITWAGYEIGRSVFWRKAYPPLDLLFFRHFDWKRFGDFYLPLFVGSVILGLVCALVAFMVTLFVIKWKRARRAKGAPHES